MYKIDELYEEEGQKILEVDLLPEKYCNFDCIFCPIGQKGVITDEKCDFGESDRALSHLIDTIQNQNPDLIFINSAGEALVNSEIPIIIERIKELNKPIKLLSNGYLFNDERYKMSVSQCDHVIGEIKVTSEEDFQKLQRPIEGYTLDQHVKNMASFNATYNGHFILEVTIIKGYGDKDASIERFKEIIQAIKPDQLMVVTLEGVFEKKLGVSEETLKSIESQLMSVML